MGRILGGLDLDYMRDENALGEGSGFAVGAALNIDTGNLNFWKFYARFMAGTGFDIMLKNYGQDAVCLNREGPLGINGWYANGQAYAFFDGKIGIRVDVFGDTRNIDIINLAAAAVLQAKLPNPLWMRGVVGGYFSVLNGLVKGDCRFEVVIGEECEIRAGSAVSGLEVIAELTPAESENDISVFNNPQAIFNLPVGKEFTLRDVDNQEKAFRIKLDHFRAKTANGTISGQIDWNSNQDVAAFASFEVLPPKSEIKIEVQISFEEKIGSGWTPVTVKGNRVIENRTTSFTTGTAPEYIPLDNIAYSYPVIGMKYYFPEESASQYIKLKKGQAYLFTKDDQWLNQGKLFTSADPVTFNLTYDNSNQTIEFQLPALTTGTNYNYQLVKTPAVAALAIDRNISSTEQNLEGENSDLQISTKKAEGVLDDLKETVLLSTSFSTSSYKTFEDKITAIQLGKTLRVMLQEWDLHQLRTSLNSSEVFEPLEYLGDQYSGFEPLISLEAELSNNNYYNTKIYPLVYNGYPINGVATIDWRNTEELGLPPVKAVKLEHNSKYSRDEINYNLVQFYRQDYYTIRNKVIPLYVNQPNPLPSQVNALIFHGFPIIGEGAYPVRINYTLPGESSPHASLLIPIILNFGGEQ